MIVTVDFESYYADDFTLTKMSTSEYVRHELFKVHMMGLKIDDEPTRVYAPDEIPAALGAIDWSKATLVCHHTAFDGFILKHCYGISPARYLCTLSMARGACPTLPKYTLKVVAELFALGTKLANRLEDSQGKTNLTREEFESLAEYCAVDVDLTKALYDRLVASFPTGELELIDLTLRMFCEPVLEVDTALVQEELEEEVSGKVAAVLSSGVSATTLMSNEKFAELLREKGVIPPTKMKDGVRKYAMAKTDAGLRELLHHPSDEVRAIVEARLTIKSTIGETRAKRFLEEAKDGPLPVYLNYYGAHTGRFSGGNKMNLQNLPRPQYDEYKNLIPTTGRLRRSLRAPAGYVLAVADSAQIEARTTAWFADQRDLLEAFDQGRDIYCEFASEVFKRPITAADKKERFVGKTCILGLGFGMGAQRLRETLLTGGVDLHLYECARVIEVYRGRYAGIPQLWRRLDSALHSMLPDKSKARQGQWKCLTWANNPARVRLPNGMFLQYPELQMCVDTRRLSFIYKNVSKDIWGGTLTENVVQATARVIITDQMRQIARRYRLVTMTHDEIVALVPELEADEGMKFMLDIMAASPSWAPDLPLKAEGGYDVCYVK